MTEKSQIESRVFLFDRKGGRSAINGSRRCSITWEEGPRRPTIIVTPPLFELDWTEREQKSKTMANMSVGALNRGYKCQKAHVTCDLAYCFCHFCRSE
ncbi:hypothetical protein Trydic_g19129 [Trypoxylus dichotomus]